MAESVAALIDLAKDGWTGFGAFVGEAGRRYGLDVGQNHYIIEIAEIDSCTLSRPWRYHGACPVEIVVKRRLGVADRSYSRVRSVLSFGSAASP